MRHSLGRIACMGKIAASVLLKLFINSDEDSAPLTHERHSIKCLYMTVPITLLGGGQKRYTIACFSFFTLYTWKKTTNLRFWHQSIVLGY